MEQLTATDVARRFSDVLNRTKYRGESFLIERGGEVIAQITPAGQGCTPAELAALFQSLPSVDAAYWDDVERIRGEQPSAELGDPWER